MRPWAVLILVGLIPALPLRGQPAERWQGEAERSLKAGDYPQAVKQAAEAARLHEAAGDKTGLGRALNTAGAAFFHQGDYPAALRYLERGLAVAREAGDRPNEILRLNNLGSFEVFLGDYAQAFLRYQAALELTAGHETEPRYLRLRQLTLGNIAILHQRLGQDQRALELFQQLRAMPQQTEPSIEAQMLTNLAVAYRRLGDPQKALDTHRAARSLLARDPDVAAALYTLHNIGVVQALDLKDNAAALRTFEEGLAIARKTGNRLREAVERLYIGETLLLMKQPELARSQFKSALAAAEELHLVDERWTALYGLGRAEVALGDSGRAMQAFEQAIAIIESARSKLGAASLKAEFLAGKRDVYDAAIALLLRRSDPDPAQVFRHIEEGRARNLKEMLPGEGKAVTLEAVKQRLDGRTMVLEYWIGQGRVAAVWMTANSAGVAHREISPGDLTMAESLTRVLSDRSSPEWARVAGQVAKVLLMPGLPLDRQGVDQLVVVPDGSLPSLPFEVLENPAGSGETGGSRLIDRFDVAYLPSAQFLGHSVRAQAQVRWPWQVTLAAFADPVVPPAQPGATRLFDTNWPRLTYSAGEAESVASALPGAERMHVGADNLRKHVLEEQEGVPVLHFATHAAVDVGDTRRSRILFSPAPGDPASQYLFWGDITKLKLSAVELVTLAACETAQGRYVRGEGVENFSRAFLAAGAAATVSSLWRVSDEATALFMKRFYSNLARGDTKAGALRQAKLSFARSNGQAAHPYFWAPFLLSGDGGARLTVALSWPKFLAALGVAALATVAAGAAIVRRKVARPRMASAAD